VSDRFVFRPLGGVQVKGKTQAVPIHELLGLSGAVADEAVRYAERFAEAVSAFQRRTWSESLAAFEACLHQRPDDLAARQYVEAIRRYVATPPADDWTGALELTEK
jgi:adenylate cyclase